MSLPDDVRNNVIDALNGVAVLTAPTPPIRVRLLTVDGTRTAAGTELSSSSGTGVGAGYTAGGAPVTFDPATAGQAVASATIRWDNMPPCTVVGAELWDSGSPPRRLQYASLTPTDIADGDAFELAASGFVETLT